MNNILEDTTFKEDLYGFFLDGNFNGNKYDVGQSNNGVSELKNQSNTGGMLVELDTCTLLDKDDVDITPVDLQERARELHKIVSGAITDAHIIAVVEDAFGITPV